MTIYHSILQQLCSHDKKNNKPRLQNSQFFSSKSEKKSVKGGIKVLRARSARASHACRACEAREKNSPVSLFVFSLVPDLLFHCSRLLEYPKIRTVLQSTIGHFRVPPSLWIKTRSSAQPLIWRWFFILVQIKLIFTREGVHLASFWKWGFLELGSGLLKRLLCWKRTRKRVSELGKRKKPPLLLHFLIIE